MTTHSITGAYRSAFGTLGWASLPPIVTFTPSVRPHDSVTGFQALCIAKTWLAKPSAARYLCQAPRVQHCLSLFPPCRGGWTEARFRAGRTGFRRACARFNLLLVSPPPEPAAAVNALEQTAHIHHEVCARTHRTQLALTPGLELPTPRVSRAGCARTPETPTLADLQAKTRQEAQDGVEGKEGGRTRLEQRITSRTARQCSCRQKR